MATGYLLNDDPYVDVSIPAFGGTITLNCLIDTGFTGFLSVSLVDAFPLGLILFGTTDVTLADGSTVSKITCLGAADIDGERKFGLFLVHPNKGATPWRFTSCSTTSAKFIRRIASPLPCKPDSPITSGNLMNSSSCLTSGACSLDAACGVSKSGVRRATRSESANAL